MKKITFGVLMIFVLAFSACDPVGPTYKELPTTEWVRAQLRIKLARVNGVPIDRNKSMPCFLAAQWFERGGENVAGVWRIGFEVDGQTYLFYGSGPDFGDGNPVGTMNKWSLLHTKSSR
jgi:hypothetical protein